MKKIVTRVGAYPLLIGLAFVQLCCSGAIPHISASQDQLVAEGWHNVDLDHGRTTYINTCGSCHKLHSPSEHTPEEWNKLFGEMASKVHLSSSDSTSIVAYLSIASMQAAKAHPKTLSSGL